MRDPSRSCGGCGAGPFEACEPQPQPVWIDRFFDALASTAPFRWLNRLLDGPVGPSK